MRIAVYSVIIGGFDSLNPVRREFLHEADFILFTDQRVRSNEYRIIDISGDAPHIRRKSRLYKMCPHQFIPEYSHWIYLDGNVELLVSPAALIKKHLNGADWAALKHPWRNCIYKEADECVRIGYIIEEKARIQMDVLRADGYPKDNGLTENGVILRRNTQQNRLFGELWYEFYMKYTQRDQLSFCYLAWKTKLKFNLIQNDIRNKYPMEFKLKEHK